MPAGRRGTCMSGMLRRVQTLVACDDVRISNHGYDELSDDDILASDVLSGVAYATLVEEYPDRPDGPRILVLQHDAIGPIHVVWAISTGTQNPAVLVTAYRPDPDAWADDFVTRKS